MALTFERYTERARRVIFFAAYEMRQLHHAEIEPEHILLGLIREDKTLLIKLSGDDGVYGKIRTKVNESVSSWEKVGAVSNPPLSSKTRRVLHEALLERDRLGHRDIGTVHQLLGLLKYEGRAAEALNQCGLTWESVYAQIEMNIFGSGPVAIYVRHLRNVKKHAIKLSKDEREKVISALRDVLKDLNAIQDQELAG